MKIAITQINVCEMQKQICQTPTITQGNDHETTIEKYGEKYTRAKIDIGSNAMALTSIVTTLGITVIVGRGSPLPYKWILVKRIFKSVLQVRRD